MAKSSASRARKCRAKTTKGTRCSRAAAPGSDYCYQHAEFQKPKSRTTSTDRKGDSAKWVRAAGLVAAIGGAGLAGKKIIDARKGKKKRKK